MEAQLQNILANASTHTTYLLLVGVLGALVAVSLWRGRKSTPDGVLPPLNLTILSFLLSRMWMIYADWAPMDVGIVMAVFSLLSLIGFYFLSVSVNRLVHATRRSVTGQALGKESLRVARPMIYFGLFAVFGYIVVTPPGSITTMAFGIGNAISLGASLPLAVFILYRVRRAPRSTVKYSFVSALLLIVSWGLFEASPYVTLGVGANAVAIARLADVLALIFVLKTIIANYVRLGQHYQARVSETVAEKEEAKTELEKLNKIAANIYEDSSDLIRKQKEQTLQFMRKMEHLERILEIGITIQRRQQLEDVLQMVVELIRDNLGFNTVTLRLYDAKAQNFETSAHVGLSDEVRDTVVNYRIPLSEYQKMIEPRFRISRSYFIRNSNTWYGQELEQGADRSVLVEDTWGEIDMLLVPLLADETETVGYLSVENPDDPKFSVADVIESLERIAALAVIGIRNARYVRELGQKNEKLRVYADKLSSLNKLKSNFVATISHEFRTPLTSIKAYCDTLLKNVESVDRELLKQFLFVIDEENTRLMSLIEDILDFSQMETGAIKFERSPCDLTEIAELAAKELEKNYRAKNITLHTELPEKKLTMQGEGELMKQLLVNLLHNASRFSKKNGNVWLQIREETATVRISVRDDGLGVPDEQLEKLFEQFHEADSTTARQFGGSGLGLAICKNIVEWHDGRIWVENVTGEGARFVAVIPKRQVVANCRAIGVYSTVRRLEVERLLELLVECVAEFLQVRKASIMLMDEENEMLRIESAIGIDEDIVEKAQVPVGEGIAGKVAKEGRPMLVANIEKDRRVSRSNNDPIYGSKSFLSVPIEHQGRILGVINVASPVNRERFNKDDSLLLELMAKRVALAIVELKRFAEASISYEKIRETLKAILEARRYIDVKDDDLLTKIVTKAAPRLGLEKTEIAQLRYIMNVYDLGLAKVGYHIIKKPNELTPKDRKEIEEHTNLGTDMLSVIERSPDVQKVVRAHHENYDGTGYPGKMKGEAIPIEARIIRVADTLRALISKRPYQRQYSIDEAIEVIKHRSGTFFDPTIAAAFVQVLKELDSELGEEDDAGSKASNELAEKPSG